jgi:hypothetical protein
MSGLPAVLFVAVVGLVVLVPAFTFVTTLVPS